MKDQDKQEDDHVLQTEPSFNPLHLENLPFPVLYKIFQNLPPEDQIALYLSSRRMWEFSSKQIVFNSNKQIEKFLISYEVLTQEELDEMYKSSSSSVLIEQIIKDYEEMSLQNGPWLYKNFLAVKSLKLDYFIIKKELLEILIGVFPNLESLVFTGDEVNLSLDIPILPLFKLNNLTRLGLTDSILKDISLIPKSLQTLRLECRNLINIEPLTNLKELKELKLYNLKNTVLQAPLGLEKLTVVWSTITDFSILLKLVQLEELDLHGLEIQDFSLLPTQQLKKLSLESCMEIKDASHLSKLEKLEGLKLKCLNITHLPSLPSGLKCLKLENCRGITNFEFLENLKELKILRLRDMMIIEISALPQQITEFSLFRCKNVKDFRPLANLNELLKLNLEETGIEDLSVLPNSLEELNLRHCKNVKDFRPLANLNELLKLNLEETGIEDLSVLPNSLEELNLSECKNVREFTPLSNLKNLRKLVLSDTQITDLSVLPNSLEKLKLWGCKYVKDFTSLSKLPNLKRLGLNGTNIEDLSVLPNSLEELSLWSCENIKFCPDWLEEKINSGSIKIRGCNLQKLLAMPSSPSLHPVAPVELPELSANPVSTSIDTPTLTSAKSREQNL